MLESGINGIQPVYNLDRNDNDGLMGGNGFFIFFLFFLLAFNGNGGGLFGGGNSNVAQNQITNEFLFNNLNNSVGRLNDTVVAGFNSTQKGICDLGYTVNSNINSLSHQLSECCCNTQRAIDSVNFNAERNTCAIIQATEKNTDRIIEKLTQTELQNLRDSLNTANLQLSQQAQSANLIATLRPTPIPSYASCNPYGGCGTC